MQTSAEQALEGQGARPQPFRSSASPAPEAVRYSFTRRFALLAFASIALVSAASAAFLAKTLVEETIHHDAVEVMQFVQSFTPLAEAEEFFRGTGDRAAHLEAMAPLLARIAAMPDSVHVNVYDRAKRVLWSTKRDMVGKALTENPELDEALEGELEVESSLLEERRYLKPEHAFLKGISDNFVETYVPIWSRDHRSVLGVIEIYRRPQPLFEMTQTLVRAVWLSALLGALFLFGSLFWVARRADRLIHSQQRQIVESETLAAVGEMSAAVAHSIRNPLASIRSSAELAQELDGESVREPMTDIVAHVDRIASWITQLLVYAQPSSPRLSRVDVAEIVDACLVDCRRDLEKRQVTVSTDFAAALPPVVGDGTLMSQVFVTLISNALDAMPSGGTLTISARLPQDGSRVYVFLADTGVGISPENLQRLFVPFHTTKKSGLGVGLPLVRRVMNRMGGSIEIESVQGSGTTVKLSWPSAR